MTLLKRLFIVPAAFMLSFILLTCSPPAGKQEQQQADEQSFTRENKPWSRWWWHGSALTKEGITAEMEAYQQAGIGGLEITPIYGVYGEEEAFIDYLSPQWMELLAHVLAEAERLDMGIDMATGTGWPFGGPWVENDDACKNMRHKVYEVNGGGRLMEKVEFIQEPYLRLVGNQIYEVNENAGGDGNALQGSPREPALIRNTQGIKIADIVDPVHENDDLQTLAIDQVQFEKPLHLICLMAFGSGGERVDLTQKVDAAGNLEWTAPEGTWKLYGVFEGFHGKMVERAGPGGEGNVIDHFSGTALRRYLAHFDEAFKDYDLRTLRGFFNDSYEVDDARGAADFTPALLEEFERRRGYDLRHELPALFGYDEDEKNRRVLSDYRETLSDLLLDNFTREWKAWANAKGKLVRNQAHGSPANILDLYAAVDIPEIEGTEPLRFRMATSSGNVTGKKLISAEAATWLNEHFTSNLADIKLALDKFMLQGVNHLVYHGTCYSPPGEPWPGRLFYAAVHLNPRNPLWKDFAELNSYVTGCQSFLQKYSPDNDILLYYPVYDRFSSPGPEMIEHFDGIGAFKGTGFAQCAERMLEKGYAFDFISDRQVAGTSVERGLLKTSGSSVYKTIVVPPCNYMPLETLEKISSLAAAGATVIFVDGGPRDVNGYGGLNARRERFHAILDALKPRVSTGADVLTLLQNNNIRRENMTDLGIQTIRKKNADGGWMYFIHNSRTERFDGWVPVSYASTDVMLFDPMSGMSGQATTRRSASGTDVLVALEPAQSLILESFRTEIEVPPFPYPGIAGEAVALEGKWRVTFETGGPALPPSYETASPQYWTDSGGESYRNFSGTASYALPFDRPRARSRRWLLKLASVKESAEVILNGKSIGTLIGPVFQLEFADSLLRDDNVLEVKVSNLMANRIAYMDRNDLFWKKFYNVNFPARLRENSRNNLLYAGHWTPRPSGLAGKVELYPLK